MLPTDAVSDPVGSLMNRNELLMADEIAYCTTFSEILIFIEATESIMLIFCQLRPAAPKEAERSIIKDVHASATFGPVAIMLGLTGL